MKRAYSRRFATLLIALTPGLFLLNGTAAAKPAGRPAPAMICKPIVKAKAKGNTPHIARNKAIAKWKSIVISLYGASFANINKAKIISVPTGFSNGKWWVIIRAKPCKSIGFGTIRAR